MKRLWPLSLMLCMLAGCRVQGNYDWHKTLALAVIVGIVGLFWILALYSNLLRDEVNDSQAFTAGAEKQRKRLRLKFARSDNPYSLSRVQLAVWTVIISCSYIYLQLCMPGCNSTDLNQTALVLMGISAAVTAGGSIMDKREMQDARSRHQNAPSEGFFVDILSDDNGVSIHRFQKVVWTVIAAIIYLNKVYATRNSCALPELDETLLILTGISSATYLAIKSQENNPPVDDVAPQTVAPEADTANTTNTANMQLTNPTVVVQPPANSVVPPASDSNPAV